MKFFALKYFIKYFWNISKIAGCIILCIVHCNKVSKPVKGKYLLLCMNSIMYRYTNLIYFNHVFKSFKSLNIEN